MKDLNKDMFYYFEKFMTSAASMIEEEELELEEVGEFYEELVKNMRPHAILNLLINKKPENFFENLIVSAYAWRHYLQRCAKKNYRDYLHAISRYDSFFDAIAGDHIPLALEIIDLGPSDWMKQDEYEEDYCWVRFLSIFARHGNAAGAELDKLIKRSEDSLQGIPSGRLEMCRALRSQDQKLFESAFNELIIEWKEEYADDDFRDEDPVRDVCSRVFIEGLSVLRLAKRIGLTVNKSFICCPLSAQVDRKKNVIDDPFAP